MRQVWLVLKKEAFHSIRNFQLFILIGVFSFLGILNVLTAKYTPLLIEYLVSKELAQIFPSPSGLDVWVQFNKNVIQTGFVIVVLLFSPLLTKDIQQGTLSLLLTKGLKRRAVLLGKWLWMVLSFSGYYLLSIGLTLLYSWLYFDRVFYGRWIVALGCAWLFALFLFSLLLFASVLGMQTYSVLLIVACTIVFLFLLHFIPAIASFNPVTLLTQFSSLLTDQVPNREIIQSVGTTLVGILAFLGGSLVLFEKKSF